MAKPNIPQLPKHMGKDKSQGSGKVGSKFPSPPKGHNSQGTGGGKKF